MVITLTDCPWHTTAGRDDQFLALRHSVSSGKRNIKVAGFS